MTHKTTPLSPAETREFLTGKTINVFDPNNGTYTATVKYLDTGECRAVFSHGKRDVGSWGLTDEGYWTQYQGFRDGERHAFTLMPTAQHVVQAYHESGERAFLQTPLPELPRHVIQPEQPEQPE